MNNENKEKITKTVWTAKHKCKYCKHNQYLTCGKFPKKEINEFTGRESREKYKDDLNSNGQCPHFEYSLISSRKKDIINSILFILTCLLLGMAIGKIIETLNL